MVWANLNHENTTLGPIISEKTPCKFWLEKSRSPSSVTKNGFEKITHFEFFFFQKALNLDKINALEFFFWKVR